MAVTLSTGVIISIASTYATATVAATAATNVSECVVTVTHNFSVGDYIEVTTAGTTGSWNALLGKVFRVKAVSTTVSFTMESIDTSSTAAFPAGGFVGATFRKITAWTDLSQVKAVSTSGGDIQFTDITSLADTISKQMPTIRSPVAMNLDVFDDVTLGWYTAVKAASDAKTPYALKMAFSGATGAGSGSKIVANAYWNVTGIPDVSANAPLVTKVALTYSTDPVRYAT